MVDDEQKSKGSENPINAHVNKWKQYLVVAVGLCGAFTIGYMAKEPSREPAKSNYNTESAANAALPEKGKNDGEAGDLQKTLAEPTIPPPDPQILLTPTQQQVKGAAALCPVKGNISGKNKIYHVEGGSFYKRVKEEMCFQTEAEAKAAGFRKSLR